LAAAQLVESVQCVFHYCIVVSISLEHYEEPR
jgi:hypothetical protein